MENRKYAIFSEKLESREKNVQQKIQHIVDETVSYIARSNQIADARYYTRDAHAKGFALVKAKFEIPHNLPDYLAQGLYKQTGVYDAVIRFSSGSPQVRDDARNGFAMGMGMKVFGVKGEVMAEGEEDCGNIDYNLINCPVFFSNSVNSYQHILKIFTSVSEYFKPEGKGKYRFMFDWLTAYGKKFPTVDAFRELSAFMRFAKLPAQNSLTQTYFSIHVLRHGNYYGKIRVIPTAQTLQAIPKDVQEFAYGKDTFRQLIVDNLQKTDATYLVQIQLAEIGNPNPIERVTEEWTEDKYPFHTIGWLTIPQQDISDGQNKIVSEHISITPWRCLEENRPMGSLQWCRKAVYSAASRKRHELNQTKRAEPKNSTEALDSTFYAI